MENWVKIEDCIGGMRKMPKDSVDLCLTDIPYDGVNRKSGGLRNLDKGLADVKTFELQEFLKEVDRVTKNTIIIFCGFGQVSEIFNYFEDKPKGTPRLIVWKKTNPSPMNGQYVYLNGVEVAIWYRKPNGTFNAHCKNSVIEAPAGRSKRHPTEKNHKMLAELIDDNSNEGQIVFDPCAGSGSHLKVDLEKGRKICGFELTDEYLYDEIKNFLIKEDN